jgi:hypothetical protein
MLPAVHLLSLIATVSIGNAGNLPLSKPFVELRDFSSDSLSLLNFHEEQ